MNSITTTNSKGVGADAPIVDTPMTVIPVTNEKVDAPPTKPLDPRPRIELPGDGRMISELGTELGQVLAPCGLYSHAGQAAIYDEETQTLAPIKSALFRTWIEDFVITFKNTKEGPVVSTMSSGDAGAVLLSGQFLCHLREVHRVNVVRLPAARSNGEIELLPEGYDRGSKILTASGTVKYATDMTLAEAKALLDGLFSEFPFADEGRSMAITIAAMLTLYGLNLMPSKTLQPVFLYRGNHVGLGKGLLAQAAMIPVIESAPTGPKPGDETELRKFLFSVAREGRSVAFLDNVTARVASPSLESFVTTSTVTGRVLGSSKSLNCRKNTVVLISGNNCTLSPDMSRRTLIVELFLAEDPAGREIKNHLDENRLLELRPQILAALYALVREWAAAGKPKPAKINPNFVVWSQVIGGIIEHAGFGSITDVAASSASVDPNAGDMPRLATRLHAKHRTEAVKFSQVVDLARGGGLFKAILKDGEDLDKADNTALGRLFSAFDQRIFAPGLRFVIIGKSHARRYAVQQLPALDFEATARST